MSTQESSSDFTNLSETQPQFEPLGICHLCVRRRDPLTCDAFPDGIPTVILIGDFNHTEEFPGDRGLQFKRK